MSIFLLLVLSITSFLILVVFIGWILSAPGYKGPKSDHFNGTTFFNGEGYTATKFSDLLKWVPNREPGTWKKITESDVEYGPKPTERISDSTQVITFINHSTFLIQTDGLNILTDPVFSKRVSPFSFSGPKRMRPPGIRFEDLPPIDLVLLSHNHYDHLDISTVKQLHKKFDPQFITPLGVDVYLKRNGITKATALDWWEETSISEIVKVGATRAQHFSSRGLFDRDKTLWCGFVIKSEFGNIYFVGDTGYNTFFPEIRERYAPIKTSLIPIGAYKPRWFMSPVHIDPKQAVQIHQDVGSELSIGMHFGTFQLTDEGEEELLNDFNEAVSEENFILLKEGESFSRE